MNIPYTPDAWTPQQAEIHQASDLEQAFHHASCLAGGWYYRPVRIDYRIVDLREFYTLRPVDVPTPDGWKPCYTVCAFNDDGSAKV